jgi:hypothetical protein
MEHRKDELIKMETTLKQYSVNIKAGETGDAFLISGKKIGIARVQEALHVLTSSVTVNEIKVQQPGLHKFFTSGRGDRLAKSVEHEHKCAIEKIENVSQKSNSVPRKDFERTDENQDTTSSSVPTGPMRMTCGNISISWKQGNIVAEQVNIFLTSSKIS